MIAEAIRRGFSYEEIHAYNQIDIWFIDKIAVLVEMEQRLRREELTQELLREGKTDRISGQCDCRPYRQECGRDPGYAL